MKKIIENKASEMITSGEYQFVTIAELTDELNEAGHKISVEEVEQHMNRLTQNSDWTWQPMPDSLGQKLYSKGFDLAIEHIVEEAG